VPRAFLFRDDAARIELGTLPGNVDGTPSLSNSGFSEARAINAVTTIAGYSSVGRGDITHAALWRHIGNTVTLTDLGTLSRSPQVGQPAAPWSSGPLSSAANALNVLNQVVGYSATGNGRQVCAVVWEPRIPTQPISFDKPAANYPSNDYSARSHSRRGYQTRSGPTITALGTLPPGPGGKPSYGSLSMATGINTAGQIVGFSRNGPVIHAAQWQKGPRGRWTIANLGTLGRGAVVGKPGTPGRELMSQALAINNATPAQVVGFSQKDDIRGSWREAMKRPVIRAVLWRDQQITDLGTLGDARSTTPANGEYSRANAITTMARSSAKASMRVRNSAPRTPCYGARGVFTT
jgi:uncharacterized membrane protein